MKISMLFICVCFVSGSSFSPSWVFLNYFKARNIRVVTYYSCRSDEHLLIQDFNKEFIQVLVLRDTRTHQVELTVKNGIIVDLACDFVPDILDFALKDYLFRNIISWIFVRTDNSSNLDLLLDTYIPHSSEVVLLTSQQVSWNIFDIYKVSKKSEMIITPLVSNLDSPRTSLDALVKYRKQRSLNGIQMTATIAFHYPDRLTRVDDLRLRHLDTATKTTYENLMLLAADLNFTYNLRQTDSYGFLKNGSFHGLMGHFERKEIEVGMISAFFRQDRMKIIEYITETFIITSPLMFRQPSLASVSNIFTLPFGFDVWWAFIALTVVLIASQILVIRSPMVRRELTLLDSMSFVLGAFCQQGFSRDLILISGRVLQFVTLLASLFLFSSYSANIVALLQSPSNALKTISDVTHSNLKVLIQKNEYNLVLYKETTDPEVITLYQKKLQPFGESIFVMPEEGVKKVKTGRYAYQVESHTAYKIISDTYTESEKCGLKAIESVKLPRISIPIVKNSSYRSIFRERLSWQREVGLYDSTFRRWVNQKFKCEGNVGEFRSVGIQECRHAFFIVAFGIGFSVVILIFEVLGRQIKSLGESASEAGGGGADYSQSTSGGWLALYCVSTVSPQQPHNSVEKAHSRLGAMASVDGARLYCRAFSLSVRCFIKMPRRSGGWWGGGDDQGGKLLLLHFFCSRTRETIISLIVSGETIERENYGTSEMIYSGSDLICEAADTETRDPWCEGGKMRPFVSNQIESRLYFLTCRATNHARLRRGANF
ncbi:Ionotropic glutamate receptor [Sergentomyia squamirostris]